MNATIAYEAKRHLDAVLEKKLNQREAKIREQADQIARLMAGVDSLERRIKAGRPGGSAGSSPEPVTTAPKHAIPEHVARGFGLLARTLAGSRVAAEEFRAEFPVKAMNTQQDSSGGVLVPDALHDEIIRLVNMYGVGRSNVLVAPILGGGTLWPKRTGGLTVYSPDEGGELTPSQVGLGRVKLAPRKWAVLALMTSEVAEDALVDLGMLIAEEMALALAQKEDDCIFNGTGAAANYFGITGLLNAAQAGAIVTMPSDDWNDIRVADLCAIVGRVAPYANAGNLKWYLNRVVFYNGICAAMLGQGGSTAEEVRAGFSASRRTILGYPAELSDILPGADGVASTPFGVFGDLKKASVLGDARQLRVDKSSEAFFASDQLAIRATQRLDFVVHDVGTATSAGSYIVLKTGSAD